MNHSSLSPRNPNADSTRSPRSERTRQSLLLAAEEVFGKQGYDLASVSDITRRAGVAQGTFYVHFVDKKALFVELVETLGRTLRAALHEATAPCGTRLEMEREGLRTFLRFAREHRNLYRIVRQCEFVSQPVYRAYYDRLADGYQRGLKRAMAAGEVRKGHPERTAYFLMGIADLAGMRWVLWEDETDLDAVVEEAIAFIRGGLAPAPLEGLPKPAARTAKPSRSPAGQTSAATKPRSAAVTGAKSSKAKAKSKDKPKRK